MTQIRSKGHLLLLKPQQLQGQVLESHFENAARFQQSRAGYFIYRQVQCNTSNLLAVFGLPYCLARKDSLPLAHFIR